MACHYLFTMCERIVYRTKGASEGSSSVFTVGLRTPRVDIKPKEMIFNLLEVWKTSLIFPSNALTA